LLLLLLLLICSRCRYGAAAGVTAINLEAVQMMRRGAPPSGAPMHSTFGLLLQV
jgi:hypothetical protein